jgi:hypothetical protein
MFNIWRIMISGNFLVLDVQDIATFTVLVGKPTQKRIHGSPTFKLKEGLEMDLKEMKMSDD